MDQKQVQAVAPKASSSVVYLLHFLKMLYPPPKASHISWWRPLHLYIRRIIHRQNKWIPEPSLIQPPARDLLPSREMGLAEQGDKGPQGWGREQVFLLFLPQEKAVGRGRHYR